jgi:hypothetical protein
MVRRIIVWFGIWQFSGEKQALVLLHCQKYRDSYTQQILWLWRRILQFFSSRRTYSAGDQSS